ncbi:MAG: response regulator transcription factor [Chloroflexaceae bacterium]|nr:response regulator transcription factor [Chloroflexaceae bacterium]
MYVLLAEDDSVARRLFAQVLRDAGYQVVAAPDGETAIRCLDEQLFDVVVTDICMGAVDGIAVLQEARKRQPPPNVILLTGFASLDTAIAALRSGAYDYLQKPCLPRQLIERVAAAATARADAMRQINAVRTIAQGIAQLQNSSPADVLDIPSESSSFVEEKRAETRYRHVGLLTVDSYRHEVSFDGQVLHLTPTEFALIDCLTETSGQVLSYRDIVRRTHGHQTNDSEAQLLLKAHIRNLRRKIPANYLVNVRGTGYMLVEPSDASAPLSESDDIDEIP